VKIKNLLTSLILITANHVQAGDFRAGGHDGNGGDAIVCTQGNTKTAELLDFYEARVMRGIQIDLGSENLSVQDKVDWALSRLRRLDTKRAERYAKRIATFKDDAQFLSGYELPDISDSAQVFLPANCKIEQLVVQRLNPPKGEKQFLVNEEIWNLLNNTNKAGILLHEAIYEEMLEIGVVRNSIKARYMNSKISSSVKEFDTPAKAECFLISMSLESYRGRSEFYDCVVE